MAALAFRPADLDRATMVVVSPPHRWTSAIVAALVPPELQRDGFQFFPIITRQLFEDSGSEAAFSGICLEAHQLFAFDVEELQNDVDQLVNSDVVEVIRTVRVAHRIPDMRPINDGSVCRIFGVDVLNAPRRAMVPIPPIIIVVINENL